MVMSGHIIRQLSTMIDKMKEEKGRK